MTGRIDRAVFAQERFLERPFLGWGPGALDALTARQFPVGGFETSHNTYLTILVDGGLVMFASFMALVTFWLVRAAQVFRRTTAPSFERSSIGVLLGVMVIFLMSGLALELKFFGYFNTLFWVSGACIECLHAMLHTDHRPMTK